MIFGTIIGQLQMALTYYLKQIAHQAVSQVPGVNVILDNIDVVS